MKETRNEKKLENGDTKNFLKVTLKLARPRLKLRFPDMLAVPHFLPSTSGFLILRTLPIS